MHIEGSSVYYFSTGGIVVEINDIIHSKSIEPRIFYDI